jgi:hypothetical protein
VSFAGEVVALWAAARLSRPLSPRALAVFVGALVLWTNLHAGVFSGVAIVLLAAVGHAWGGDRAAVRRGVVVAAAAALAAAATPVGPAGLVRYLALHLHLPALHPVDEFRSATWRSDAPFFLFCGAAAITLALAAVAGRAGRRRLPRTSEAEGPQGSGKLPGAPLPGSTDPLPPQATGSATSQGGPPLLPAILPALGMAVLGLVSVRFAADAALIAAPVLATGLTRAGARWRRLGQGRTWALPAVTVALLLGAALVPRARDAGAGRRALDLRPPCRCRRSPSSSATACEIGCTTTSRSAPISRTRASPVTGCSSIPACPPTRTSCTGCWAASTYRGRSGIRRWSAMASTARCSPTPASTAGWRGGIRRAGRWCSAPTTPGCSSAACLASPRFTVEDGTTIHPLPEPPAGSPVARCEWQRRLGDLLVDLDDGGLERARSAYDGALSQPGCLAAVDEARLAAFLGGVDLAAGLPARALPYLERALRLTPADGAVRASRAAAYLKLGRRADAAADWARVTAAPADATAR